MLSERELCQHNYCVTESTAVRWPSAASSSWGSTCPRSAPWSSGAVPDQRAFFQSSLTGTELAQWTCLLDYGRGYLPFPPHLSAPKKIKKSCLEASSCRREYTAPKVQTEMRMYEVFAESGLARKLGACSSTNQINTASAPEQSKEKFWDRGQNVTEGIQGV